MPKIKWLGLPPEPRRHLFDRAKERQIGVEDIFALEEWRRHSPDVPDGPWYKDFGSFKLCGEGQYPKTFLLKGQPRRSDVDRRCPRENVENFAVPFPVRENLLYG